MAGSSLSIPGQEYPYPSNVFVPSFVTVNLSGRDNYIVWKTQMLCLLESHDMLGFIDGEFTSPESDEKHKAWRRSDALVKGWILGSLSQQTISYVVSRLPPKTKHAAKDVWDVLQSRYDHPLPQPFQHPQEVVEEYQYPYPSHVFVGNFVTVKLSGRQVYGVWKTQMLCLLKSHDMLGFINGTLKVPTQNSFSAKETVGDYILWKRSDELVKGWILGSLAEQTLRYVVNLVSTNDDFISRDVWDKLHAIYGPSHVQAASDLHVELKTSEPESPKQVNLVSKEAKLDVEENKSKQDDEEEEKKKKGVEEKRKKEEEEHKKKKARERDEGQQRLYDATLRQNIEDIRHILATTNVTLTDKITINGNTALHVAVGTTKKRDFLVEMLNLAEKDNQRLDMRNSEGSTLLHVASIVGNTVAAKILLHRNPKLLFAKDKDNQTPVARAFSNMHTETYIFFLNNTYRDVEMGGLFSDEASDELLVNAISSKDSDSVEKLLENYVTIHTDAVLMALAQNFPSELSKWDKIAYKLIEPFHLDYIDVYYFENNFEPTGSFFSQVCYAGVKYASALVIWLYVVVLRVLVWPFKFAHMKGEIHHRTTTILHRLCVLITSNRSQSDHQYYTNPILEASRQNANEFVEIILKYFPNAIWSSNEDGHNIIQYAVINRSEKVYNLLYQMSEHKNIYKTIKDSSGNNLLHLAATLAPTNKLNLISGAALQIQRELQWFQEVEKFVCPLNIIQKNSLDETPQMVFTREHKELVIEGEKWMKTTAESYTITAALITTIMFAAAITVPGGTTQETGIPVFTRKVAFSIFAISDAISMFTSVTSLLMFLSILTARFAEQDFLLKLPTKLVVGLVMLFISTTAMIIAFGATLFLVFGRSELDILFPIAMLTLLPITSFVTLQLPLVWEFISATYGRSIFGKQSDRPFY